MKLNLKLGYAFSAALILFSFLLISQSVQAQTCEPGVTACASDADCQQVCPTCVTCDVGAGVCVANDTVCQAEEGLCREGLCAGTQIDLSNPSGCDYSAPAIAGITGLDDICYICAPPVVAGVNTCGNGICDEGDGEDCQTCPADCLVPGFAGDCPSQTEADSQCNIPNESCTNGEICDQGTCLTALACDITARTCSGDNSDLCCSTGCEGPPSGVTCADAEAQGLIPAGQCDVDCWPVADCGDGLVENPETCDGNVGLGADGAAIADGACRDPGAAAQCTFCGDGIIQAEAGEECDGTNDAACGGDACSANCTCQSVCVTGSGNPFDTIRDGCGNCNLNVDAISQGWFKDYGLWIALMAAAGLACLLRRRFIKH